LYENRIICDGKSNLDAKGFGIGLAQKAAVEKWAERMGEKILA